jgi:hypothetical protein
MPRLVNHVNVVWTFNIGPGNATPRIDVLFNAKDVARVITLKYSFNL